MTIRINHRFESGKSDGSDPTLVQPSDWNDGHDMSTAAGKLIGSDISGPGTVQELPGAFDTAGNFTLTDAKGFFLGAKGTTGERPTVAVAGYERWNTTTSKKEFYDGADWQNTASEGYVDAAVAAIPLAASLAGFISGMTYAVSGANEIDVASGSCASADAVGVIILSAATKRIDVAWAQDNGATPTGSLDTGVIADSPYFIFAIKNPTTGATATLTSLSPTAPVMPAGFTLKRLIGWFRRAAGDLVLFNTYELAGGGLDFRWASPTLDISALAIGTARGLAPLGSPLQVPAGLSVLATMALQLDFIGGTSRAVNVSCPDQTDAAVAFGAALLGTAGFVQAISLSGGDQFVNGNGGSVIWEQRVRTDTSGQVAMRASGAGAAVSASVIGFEWSRR